MKKDILKVLIVFLFFCFCTQIFSQSLVKKEERIKGKNEFSYINSQGKIIVPYGRYDFAYTDTIETVGFVLKRKNNIVAIDNKGKELFNVFIFDNGLDYPVNNIFRIIKNNKMGLADMTGNHY